MTDESLLSNSFFKALPPVHRNLGRPGRNLNPSYRPDRICQISMLTRYLPFTQISTFDPTGNAYCGEREM